MTLEDIPEMQVMQLLIDRGAFNLSRRPLCFEGYFVVIKAPHGRIYVFTSEGGISHQMAFQGFETIAQENYGIQDTSRFEAVGGGILKIDSALIELSDRSIKYGKYAETMVRPIVERFRDENLLEHRIEFS